MRSIPAAVFVLLIVGCGGGGDSKPDAFVFLDAPAALTGLGQRCGAGMPMCPATAPGCLGPVGGAGFCTNLCGGTTIDMMGKGSGTFMTDAASMVVAASVMPPVAQWLDAPCQMIYSGGVGAASCSSVINRAPAGNFTPNTTYTFAVACEIACGAANECPTGFTCDTAAMFKVCRVM
jgi:hypothetical protein